MSRKAVLAVMAVVVLGGLNLWRYAGAPSDAMDPTSNGSSRGLDMQQISPLPRFNFPVTASTTPPQASRDLFDVVNAPTRRHCLNQPSHPNLLNRQVPTRAKWRWKRPVLTC